MTLTERAKRLVQALKRSNGKHGERKPETLALIALEAAVRQDRALVSEAAFALVRLGLKATERRRVTRRGA